MVHVNKVRKRSAAKRFAEIERISIFGITERMGPVALHLYADRYLSAAKALPIASVPFEPVRPYLLCHSIELALKAFLSLNGAKMIDLAEGQFGHRLASLLKSAESAGLKTLVPLSEPQCKAIQLADFYYAGKVFEYPAVGEASSAYPQMPPLELLLEAAELLTGNLAKPCKEAK